MAKKKKTQLKPVARPFATSSVPKKVVPVVEEEKDEALQEGDAGQGDGPSGEGGDDGEKDGGKKVEEVSEEVKMLMKEEAELQALVDRLQEKTEKEINRTIKAVEYDRRFSKSLSTLTMDPVIRSRIFQLLQEEEQDIEAPPMPALDEDIDKVLVRIGIVYGSLMRFGFTEERVLECLRAVQTFELDEAFDWLYLHCDEEELDFGKDSYLDDSSRTPVPQTPRTPSGLNTPTGFSPMTPSISATRYSLSRRESSFSVMSLANSVISNSTSASALKTPIKEKKFDHQSRGSEDDNGESEDAESTSPSESMSDLIPNSQYARIKLRMFERSLRPNSSSSAAEENAADEARLVQIRQQYLFKEKDAEAEFRILKATALKGYKDTKLRESLKKQPGIPNSIVTNGGAHTPLAPPRKPSGASLGSPFAKTQKQGRHRPPSLVTATSSLSLHEDDSKALKTATLEGSEASGEHKDSDSSGGTEGGMFGTMLDEMPTTEIVPSGADDGSNIVIRIRDMALPRQFGGRTPKLLLQETIQKTDKYASVAYFKISGSSRAVRCGVSVRWGSKRRPGAGLTTRAPTQEWRMEEDGCIDQNQAEQFVATVALHDITFASTAGFASAVASTGGAAPQTHFRVLPSVYRDLWDELENARKETESAMNRSIWRKLKEIVEPRIGTITKAPKANKVATATQETDGGAPHHQLGHVDESISAIFRARQMTQAYQEMFLHRMQLPIAPYRNEIVTALDNHQVLVLSGETGCGKSTQVPAFILEEMLSRGRHCKIYCTEPRRISAISLAQRVSLELGDAPGQVGTNASMVGYSIRLESNTSRSTRLAYVTNGIALRMLESGSGAGGKGTAFDEITHIIIDEVHERSIESDFLLIVLKSLLEQRPSLKVVLMSATLDAEKVSAYFGDCPILYVPGRTFPVDIRYLEDAVELTQWTIPDGSPYAKRLNDKFHKNGKNAIEWSEDAVANDDEDENSDSAAPSKLEPRYSPSTVSTINTLDERNIPYDLIIRLMETICYENETYIPFSAAILVFMPGMNEIRRLHDALTEHNVFGNADLFRIHPLHSTISTENQGAVFDLPPVGVRKIVIATNIAETGITIPDITCVIDSGKHREMRFDEKRQISRLVETYIAKSNAAQRRGRAGRVQSGLCFHLFTKFRHDTLLADHPLPEMMRLSLSDLALRTKILKVKIGSSIEDILTRALDPPSSINIQRAVSALVEVKALASAASEEITPMGRLLSKLPTDVHLGKFLLIAATFSCLDPALTIVACLNSKSPFISPFGFEAEAEKAKNSFKVEGSDFLTIQAAFSSWRRAASNGPSAGRTFCRKNYLSYQNLTQIEEIRQQLLGYLVDASFLQVDKTFERELLARSKYSAKGGGRVRFVSVPEQYDRNARDANVLHAALTAGLYPKILSLDSTGGQWKTIGNNQPTAFHPSSVNFQRRARDFDANHLCYFTLMHSKKLYVWESGPVDDAALFLLCGDADFKLSSNSAFLDRKIKVTLQPKTNIALKILREHLSAVLAAQMRGKPLSAIQQRWNDLAMLLLSRVLVEVDDEGEVGRAKKPVVDVIF